MKGFLSTLWSKKLWAMLLGIAGIVGAMMSGSISIPDGIDKITILIIAYLTAQGAVDVTKVIKNGTTKGGEK